MRFWLGPWVWDTADGAKWRMPSGATHALDLRSTTNCGIPITPLGDGLFVTDNAGNLGAAYTNLGTDPDRVLSGAQKLSWQARLGLPLSLTGGTLKEIVWETVTIQADPTGEARCKPLVPTTRREFELHFGGSRFFTRPFAADLEEWTPVIDMLKREYRAHREYFLARNSNHYLKILGYWCRKYGLPYRAFQPADLPDEADLPPETTLSDNFTDTHGIALTAHTGTGGGFSWTHVNGTFLIVTNECGIDTGTHGSARAEADLSSADHYCQIDRTVSGSSVGYASGAARFAAAAETFYLGLWRSSGPGLYKKVTGTLTELSTALTAEDTNHTYKVEINGTTLKGYRDGVEDDSVTDSAISSNTRCGQSQRSIGDQLDNWEAADLAAAAANVPRDLAHTPHHQAIMAM